MKIFTLFLFFLLTISGCKKNDKESGQLIPDETELRFIQTNINDILTSVFFTDAAKGFVAGYSGGIYKTVDSGKTWTPLISGKTVPIYDIFFTNVLRGFAVGGENSCGGTGCIPPGGFILRTIDGGQSWTQVYTPSEKYEISSIFFINDQIGFCAGVNVIYKTIDGGITWSEQKINNLQGNMMNIHFTNEQNGYIPCLNDKILITKDGGTLWEITNTNKNQGYYDISGINSTLFASGQGRIIKSDNAWSTWTELKNAPYDIFAIHFFNSENGYAFGRGNYSGGDWGHSYASIYHTKDGGTTWNGNMNYKEISVIRDVSFPNSKIGYAVSLNKILRISHK